MAEVAIMPRLSPRCGPSYPVDTLEDKERNSTNAIAPNAHSPILSELVPGPEVTILKLHPTEYPFRRLAVGFHSLTRWSSLSDQISDLSRLISAGSNKRATLLIF